MIEKNVLKKKIIFPIFNTEKFFCELCLSKKIKKIFTRTKIKSLIKNNYKFIFKNYYCQNCQYVFSKNVPSTNFLKKYYQEYPESFEHVDKKELNIRLKPKKFFLNKKILFIGENKKNYLKFNNSIFSKNKVTFANLKNINFLNKKFDIILCYFVLEHTNNIRIFLKNLKRLSNHFCKLYIEVPDSIKYFKSSFEGEHLCHFTKKNMLYFLNQNYGTTKSIKKSRFYGIRFLSIFDEKNKNINKNKKIGINKNYFNKLVSSNSKNSSGLKKILKHIPNNKKIGFVPANQDTLDIISNINSKKNIFIFDKNFLSKNFRKGFFKFKVYDYNALNNIKIHKFIVSSKKYQKEIISMLKNNFHIKTKSIIINPTL